jgi:hypothetical protein
LYPTVFEERSSPAFIELRGNTSDSNMIVKEKEIIFNSSATFSKSPFGPRMDTVILIVYLESTIIMLQSRASTMYWLQAKADLVGGCRLKLTWLVAAG